MKIINAIKRLFNKRKKSDNMSLITEPLADSLTFEKEITLQVYDSIRKYEELIDLGKTEIPLLFDLPNYSEYEDILDISDEEEELKEFVRKKHLSKN